LPSSIFPSARVPCDLPDALKKGLGITPLRSDGPGTTLLSYHQKEVQELKPDFHWLGELDSLGIISPPPCEGGICVALFMRPGGVSEDPVTGSAHCSLIPYWSEDCLRKNESLAAFSRGEYFARTRENG